MAELSAAALIREAVTARAIGIAGLDVLGLAIARRLTRAGLRIVGWDRDAGRRGALGRLGGLVEAASGPADLGADCDVVLSTLPPAELFAAAIGDTDRPGFALEMAPGSLVVDLGAAMPSDAQRLAVLLGRGGIGLVDAPVLGSAADAETGSLVLPTGGFPDFVERLAPLLGLLGTVQPAGAVGRGHALAALATLARHGEAAAAREALAVGLACGLTASLMPDIAAAAAAGPADDDPRLAVARRMAAETAGGSAAPRTAPPRAAAHRR